MTKKVVPLSIKSKRHYKNVCLVSQGLTSAFLFGCNVLLLAVISPFGWKRLSSALYIGSLRRRWCGIGNGSTLLPLAHLVLFEKLDVSAAVSQFRILLHRQNVIAFVAWHFPHG